MRLTVSLVCGISLFAFPHAALSKSLSRTRAVGYEFPLLATSKSPVLKTQGPSRISRSDVTVQIINGEQRGSGILLRGLGNETLVVTNMHVVNGASQICVVLNNGNVYTGLVVLSPNYQYDLAFVILPYLRRQLPFAEIYNSSGKELAPVVASGYNAISNEYLETIGVTVDVLQGKRLQSGYSLTYSNPIEKGMSGGGVFSEDNKLVGINALHADPLWYGVWLDDDGKTVSKKLARRLDHLSVGIDSDIIHQELSKLNTDHTYPAANITCPSRG